MVEPAWIWRLAPGAGALLVALALPGCSVVPKSRLDDCRKLGQTVQAENERLKDERLSLMTQNQDLTQRAVDDANRLKVQDEAIRRLEKSVLAYQSERNQLDADFGRVKRLLQASANPVPTALIERLRSFAEAHPGCAFDAGPGVLSLPASSLFEPGSDRPRAEAVALLRAAADRLNEPEARGLGLRVASAGDPSPDLRAASLDATTRRRPHLGLDRAARVRDLLAAEGGIDRARIEVAAIEPAPGDEPRPDDARGPRIEIALRPGPTDDKAGP